MNLTGKVRDVTPDFKSKKVIINLELNEFDSMENIYTEFVYEKPDIDIEIKKHREKRSLNANAYFHVLVGKLADAIGLSKPRCKNLMLGRYGQAMKLDSGAEAVIKTNIPVNQMMEDESIHCLPVKQSMENGKEIVFYKIIRGSSSYDTKEMSVLLNGVVEECKEQKIETMTPTELERMVNAWRRA